MTPHQKWLTTYRLCSYELVYLGDGKAHVITKAGHYYYYYG